MTKPMNVLSPRQKEIREMVFQGLMDKEIACELCISEETVAHHLRILYRKFCVHSRIELITKHPYTRV